MRPSEANVVKRLIVLNNISVELVPLARARDVLSVKNEFYGVLHDDRVFNRNFN